MCEISRKKPHKPLFKKIMAITEQEFKDALSLFASGVTVVTTKDADGNLHGLTVSAFCSLSLSPPLILICIDKNTHSHHAFRENAEFVVNILREDQLDVSNQFASHIPDKFVGIEHILNENNIPVLLNALVNLECRLQKSCDGGDHTIFIGEITKSHISDGRPLIYCDGGYRKLEA